MIKDLGNSGVSPAVIRLAAERDIPAITAIYGHHVRHGLASFEEIAPSENEMGQRFEDVRNKALPSRCSYPTRPRIETATTLLKGAPPRL